MKLREIFSAIGVAAILSGCSSYGPGGIHYSASDPSGGVSPIGTTAASPTGGVSGNATGATIGSGSGSVSGSAPPEKEQRGNTPIGQDRDGHGPAAGAIIDPTGAVTGNKPY